MAGRVIQTKSAPGAIGPYSQGIVTPAGFIFTAGQIALNPLTGEIDGRDIRTQTGRVLENLKAILEAGGSSLSGVVKTTVFLKDLGEFIQMNEVYGQYFNESPPARSTVEVARLPKDVLVEIEAIAMVEQR